MHGEMSRTGRAIILARLPSQSASGSTCKLQPVLDKATRSVPVLVVRIHRYRILLYFLDHTITMTGHIELNAIPGLSRAVYELARQPLRRAGGTDSTQRTVARACSTPQLLAAQRTTYAPSPTRRWQWLRPPPHHPCRRSPPARSSFVLRADFLGPPTLGV